MGRQLRRVPLDFGWPMNETWEGFINPFYMHRSECGSCDGTGYSPQAKLFSEQWYGKATFDPVAYGSKPLTIDSPALIDSVRRKIRWADELVARGDSPANWYTNGGRIGFDLAVEVEVNRLFSYMRGQWCHQLSQADVDALVSAGRLVDFTSSFVPGEGWKLKDPPVVPTAEEVNAWSLAGLGHDGINQWVCVKARCERESVEDTCTACDGNGDAWESPESKQKFDEWKETEPPAGDGYQIWETVSEGSPVSPVFATPDELADWMVLHDDSVTKDTTRDQWLAFINGPGWAPSLIQDAKGIRAGTQVTAQK